MKLSIHAHQLRIPEDALSFVRKHVLSPIGRIEDTPATELTVFVEDARPGRGGADQACKMTFRMPGARTLRVESVKDDVHAALLACAHRLRRLVLRELAKQRSPSRATQSRPLGRTWRLRATRSGVAPDGTPSSL